MSFENTQINTQKAKIKILKDCLIEERKKTSNLQKEVNSLKDVILKKEEEITNLKNHIKVINETMIKIDPKGYNDFILNQPNIPIDYEKKIQKLTKANEELNTENSLYKEQNFNFKNKFEALVIELNKTKEEYEYAIRGLKKQVETQNYEIKNNQEKQEVIKSLFNQYDTMKFQLTQEIEILKREKKEIQQEKSELKKELDEKKEYINSLESKIEKLNKDNEIIIENSNESKEITKEHYFQGKIFELNKEENNNDKQNIHNNRKISIYFGENTEGIVITIDNCLNFILLKDINWIKIIKNTNNKINLNFNKNDKKVSINCEFNLNECPFIIKFYEEMKEQALKLPNFIFGYEDYDYFFYN